MARMEIHPGEGGADAQTFALELASAVGKYAGQRPATDGSLVTLHRL